LIPPPWKLSCARHSVSWEKGPAVEPAQIEFTPAKPGYYLVTKSDVNQSNIAWVELGTRRDNPDYYAIQVFDEALSVASLRA